MPNAKIAFAVAATTIAMPGTAYVGSETRMPRRVPS